MKTDIHFWSYLAHLRTRSVKTHQFIVNI